jgi:glycosyltransferase involved in cell wall biosynthesis
MKVSIVTVCLNSEKTIRETLESIYLQTYPSIEHIIIDGGSVDNTLEIIQSFSRSKILITEKDNGIYDAMNKGVSMASGEVIGILNSDDLFENEMTVQTVMDHFRLNPEVDVVYGDLNYVNSKNVDKIVRKWKSKAYYIDFFEHGDVPAHPSIFLKRKVYEEAGLFNLDFSLAADYEFMLRIFKKHDYNSKYVNNVFVKMRLGGATNQSFLNVWKQNIEIVKAWKHNELKMPFLLIPLRIVKRILQYI